MLEKNTLKENPFIISFVILHFGDWRVTNACIQSILKMNRQDQIQIVVIDNDIKNSIIERNNWKEKYRDCEKICVIQNFENGGFSHANNIGYAYAREEQKASFIVVLNNDTEFLQDDFVEQLIQAYSKNPCHVLAPDIVKASTKEHQNPMDTRIRTKEEAEYTIRMNQFALKWYAVLYPFLYVYNKYNAKKQLKQKQKKQAYYNEIQRDIVPFGACLIFTPKFVEVEEKAFDPETEFYYEEYILALRCQKKGYIIVYDPRMKLLHESGFATQKKCRNKKQHLKFMMEKIIGSCRIYMRSME